MRKALVVSPTLAVLIFGGATVAAQKPGDACALLQASEIQAVAGTAKVGAGQASTDALGSQLCRYQWGSGNNVPSGQVFLDVTVTPLSKAYPGTNPALVKQGLLAIVKAGDANASVIAGVGDAAIYQSTAPIRAEMTALVKGNILIISFQSADARAKKDQVIALLKAAAGRL